MSTYQKITKHPETGVYEVATYHDDYFGPHVYGVGFKDGKVWPLELVQAKQLKELWFEDVVDAFGDFVDQFDEHVQDRTIEFLNLIEKMYKLRWKQDPQGGKGAVEYYRDQKFKNS